MLALVHMEPGPSISLLDPGIDIFAVKCLLHHDRQVPFHVGVELVQTLRMGLEPEVVLMTTFLNLVNSIGQFSGWGLKVDARSIQNRYQWYVENIWGLI